MVAAKILIVEDEVLIAREIEDTLLRLGYGVSDIVTTAEEAIHSIVQSPPDLVLMDIALPGEMDGIDVAAQVGRGFQIPVVYMTAYADAEKLERAKATEPFGYVVKPYRTDALHATLEIAIARQQAEARKLSDLRERISLAFPHELNTPLNGIILAAQLLMQHYSSLSQEKVLRHLQTILNNATRLHHISQNFLFYTVLEAAAADPEAAKEFTSGSMSVIRPFIKAFSAQKAEEFKRTADLDLKIEESHLSISVSNLRKIVEELLDNAFKFSEAGSLVQVVGVAGAESYSLTVSDRGRGFTPEQLNNRGAYMQHDRSYYEQQGLGLGLFIVQRLVELHHGSLSIDSKPAQGTTISLSLPC